MDLCYKCGKNLVPKDAKHGLHTSCFAEWFGSDEDFQDLTLRKELQINADEGPLPNASFFHGKFEKYSATLGEKQYILKISRDFPELAKTEYLCNQLADTLKIPLPRHYLIRFVDQDCFISYNFMQDYGVADLKHIYHFLTLQDTYNLETLVKVIGDQTGRLPEIKKFLNLCLFDALIGNDDRHGRNLGLIFTQTGCLFSPCYDNPSFIARMDEDWLGLDLNSSGAIQTRDSQEPTMQDYVIELARLGYQDVVEEFKNNIVLQHVELLINGAFISEKRKAALTNFIHKKYKELNSAASL